MEGGVSSAAIEVLLQNLVDVFKQEYSLIRDLKEEAEQLKQTLRVIQAYLNDAEKKSISEEAVKLWLKELEALAFEADNVLDEFSYHLLRKKVKNMKSPQKKVQSCFSPFKHIASRRNMALKIKDINKNFKAMSTRASDLGLQNKLTHASAAVYASMETDSLTLDPIFIGRDDDVDKLVDVATESETPHERKFSILAIVGMGGLGKTTLTRKVFNHEKMEARFGQSRIWVHVSETFDPIILLKKILSALTLQTSEAAESREVILKKLQEALKDKTYLLVLDDVWNQDVPKWEEFMNSISGATSTVGNAIIMSTRKEDVASKVGAIHTHPLKGLSDEECWSIIKAKAFDDGEAPPSGFEMVGREIAERCKGLPLAANVVGGLLHGCKTLEEWRLVNGNRLLDVEGGENILKILKLSYDHLASPSLKKSFAYCSIFPKGRQMKNQELIEMWMAEGFLQAGGRNEESMESVGNKFCKVLLHNSLLLASKRDKYGNVESCVMHDLVHDLASSVLGASDTADGNTPLRYMFNASEDKPNPISKEVAKHLRTLVLEGDISSTVFTDFESLRVLVLDSYGAEKLPNSIRKLIHLRLLDISQTAIKELPEWIDELHHLQTLRGQKLQTQQLISTLEYLTNLSHLHVELSDMEFPAGIGRLTGLLKLHIFSVGNENGYQIAELGSLKNLKGKLEIRNLERVRDKEEALKANISHKPNLLKLVFIWDKDREAGETNDNDESVLEGLQPHADLKKLRIYGYKGRRFPSWTQKMAVRDQGDWVTLNSLIEIKLYECWECEEIPMLGHLPNLESLDLRGLKKVRFINSPSNKLTRLSLSRLEGLECLPDWLFYNNPNLSYLYINECPKLRELPDGLHTLTSLERLTISHCPNLKSLELGGLKNVRFINSPFNKLTRLSLSSLEGLECLPDWLFYKNPNLENLYIEECPKLRELPDGLHTLTSLQKLSISHCPNLKSIKGNNNNIPGGGSLGGGGVFRKLWIEDCGNLVELPRQMVEYWAPSLVYLRLTELRSLQNLPMLIDCLAKSAARLETLTIEGVPKFMASSNSSSVESWPCGSLWDIEIDVSMEWSSESSGSIKETVEAMLKGCPNSLTRLTLKGRIDWDWLPASIQYLVSLGYLELVNIGVEELPQWLGNLSSLKHLNLKGMIDWDWLPASIQYLVSLGYLELVNIGVEELPQWLGNLSSLWYLGLRSCNKLRRLPPGDAYKALTNLYIRDCPELEVDSEWLNIPRLTIQVDGRRIKSAGSE